MHFQFRAYAYVCLCDSSVDFPSNDGENDKSKYPKKRALIVRIGVPKKVSIGATRREKIRVL